MRDLFVYYSASFGKGDGSDVLEYEVYPTEEQNDIFMEAVFMDKDLNDIPELENLIQEAYDEIEEVEIENLLEYEDDYVEECVENGESPFDTAYDLYVRFPDTYEFEPEYEDVEWFIKRCLAKDDWDTALEVAGEYDFDCDDDEQLGVDEKIQDMLVEFVKKDPKKAEGELEDFVEKYECLYSSSSELYDFAFKQAVIFGMYDYVEEHVYEVDLNNGWDGECTYLDDTDDPKMIEILVDAGAIGDYEEYEEEYDLAIDSMEWEIITFKRPFQIEVLERYMEVRMLSNDDIIEILLAKDTEKHGRILEELDSMGVELERGIRVDVGFRDMAGESGGDLMSLAQELGFDFEFDGTKNHFEQNGIYYI